MKLIIGVLAIQGAFIEHIQALQKLGTAAREVRLPQELDGLSGLIIPGGESTSILRVMHDFNTYQPLKELAEKGLPVWGTCAGMVCLANRVVNNGMKTLAVMDIEVKRNAFGRQVDSFETDLDVTVLGEKPFHAVFIRAPVIETVGEGVTILAKLGNGTPVAARQGKFLATSFHPELTDDLRFHRYFLELVNSK